MILKDQSRPWLKPKTTKGLWKSKWGGHQPSTIELNRLIATQEPCWTSPRLIVLITSCHRNWNRTPCSLDKLSLHHLSIQLLENQWLYYSHKARSAKESARLERLSLQLRRCTLFNRLCASTGVSKWTRLSKEQSWTQTKNHSSNLGKRWTRSNLKFLPQRLILVNFNNEKSY